LLSQENLRGLVWLQALNEIPILRSLVANYAGLLAAFFKVRYQRVGQPSIRPRDDRTKATESEIRGEDLFFGKANCATCHTAPYYTDNLMHDLKVERFFKPRMEGGMMITAQGPIKTFPLRGIKESRRICTTEGCSRWKIRLSSSI